LLPKGKGEGWMVSDFQGRKFGLGKQLTELEMVAINAAVHQKKSKNTSQHSQQ
jgi:hypothetical protein